MRRGFVLSLTCLFFTLTFAEAVPRVEWEVVQPAESRQGLVLHSQPGRARVRTDGRTRSYGLRADERLSDVLELGDGWAAAGQAVTEGRSRLVVFADDSQGFRRLDLPADGEPALQLRPRLLGDDGRLTGLAWLEGPTPRKTAIRARRWTGADWGPVTTVSPEGRGSQTGLAAATLRDGTELLVWSGFDGHDDEILSSVNRAGDWSAPQRVTAGNRVPDVTPSVIAAKNGALVAWSRASDEGYEIVVAAYRRGGWRTPRTIGAGLFPELVRREGRLYLLYRTASPRGWQVVELDENGRIERSAGVLGAEAERPELEIVSNTGVQLRWPARAPERASWGPR